MKALGCSVLLILWACCGAQGKACEYPGIDNGRVSSWNYRNYRDHYFPMTKGRGIDYECDRGYATESGYGSGRITCTDEGWTPAPRCRQITCPAPAIPYGTITNGKPIFRKDERLEFSCERGYQYEGRTPECTEEGWNPKPFCKEIECYYQNVVNGQMLPRRDKYRQDDTVDLNCHRGFVALYSKDRKPTCTIDGWVPPLKCETPPVCSRPPLVPHGRIVGDVKNEYNPDSSIEYECNEDYALEGTRMLTCIGGIWSGGVPQCIRPCHLTKDEIDKNFLELYQSEDISQAVKHKTSIPFKCKESYVKGPNSELIGHCKNGTITYPTCVIDSPCQVTKDELEEHSVELSSIHRAKTAFKEGDTITFTCIYGFRALAPPGILVAKCTKAGFTYPTCINPTPCRVSQEGTDLHNLELVGDDVTFHHGAIIQFKCKPGYSALASLNGTCKNSIIEYPTCLPKGSCILEQKELNKNNIKLRPAFADLVYATDNQIIEFSCEEGYIKHISSSDLSQACVAGIIAYPTCVKARTRG